MTPEDFERSARPSEPENPSTGLEYLTELDTAFDPASGPAEPTTGLGSDPSLGAALTADPETARNGLEDLTEPDWDNLNTSAPPQAEPGPRAETPQPEVLEPSPPSVSPPTVLQPEQSSAGPDNLAAATPHPEAPETLPPETQPTEANPTLAVNPPEAIPPEAKEAASESGADWFYENPNLKNQPPASLGQDPLNGRRERLEQATPTPVYPYPGAPGSELAELDEAAVPPSGRLVLMAAVIAGGALLGVLLGVFVLPNPFLPTGGDSTSPEATDQASP